MSRIWNTTTEQKKAALMVVAAVAETVRELGSVPSGHLYALLMDKMELAGYEKIVGILKGAELVEEKDDLLTWVGPVIA